MDSWSRPDENDRYVELINGSLHDPTIKRIKRDCDKCGKKITKMLLLGTSEKVMFVCDCESKRK